jgi:hypothetical protein
MQNTYRATIIGSMAFEGLKAKTAGKVLGVTSRGVFLISGDSVMFLTNSQFKSPFNLQVNGFERIFKTLQVGDTFKVNPSGIQFTSNNVLILIDPGSIWTPTPPELGIISLTTQRERISQLLDQMRQIQHDKGWLFLKSEVIGRSIEPTPLQAKIGILTQSFITAFDKMDSDAVKEAGRSLLGLGSGLTPSGDDWLAGFILTRTRLGQAAGETNAFLEYCGEMIQKMAFEKTTSISANRLAAARRGWSEELFLEVLDYLTCEDAQLRKGLVEQLVEFGHSSGIDTCMGILSALD